MSPFMKSIMRFKYLFAVTPLLLSGCGDDTGSEERLTAAAAFVASYADRFYALENYELIGSSDGLVFKNKDPEKAARGTFTMSEPQRCVFKYDWQPTGKYSSPMTIEVDYNKLDLGGATAKPSENSYFSFIIVPGLPGAYKESAGRESTSSNLQISVESQEVSLYQRRLTNFQKFCPGRS